MTVTKALQVILDFELGPLTELADQAASSQVVSRRNEKIIVWLRLLPPAEMDLSRAAFGLQASEPAIASLAGKGAAERSRILRDEVEAAVTRRLDERG